MLASDCAGDIEDLGITFSIDDSELICVEEFCDWLALCVDEAP